MKRIALLIFLITLYLAPQLPAQAADSLLSNQCRHFIISQSVQMWSLLHSYYRVNGKLPENLEQLQEYSTNSIIIFDTSYISNYQSLDSATASFDFVYGQSEGAVINDTIKLLSLTAKITRLSFAEIDQFFDRELLGFSGEILSARFLISNQKLAIDGISFSTHINMDKYISAKRYIKIENNYPVDSPEYVFTFAMEKIRNCQWSQYFELLNQQQLDSVKIKIKDLFIQEKSDSVRMDLFGIKTLQEYDQLSGAELFTYRMRKFLGRSMDISYLTGKDGLKILGSIPDADVTRIMVKSKSMVYGKTGEVVKNYEMIKINGKYYIPLYQAYELISCGLGLK
jgi:hypothetical protein